MPGLGGSAISPANPGPSPANPGPAPHDRSLTPVLRSRPPRPGRRARSRPLARGRGRRLQGRARVHDRQRAGRGAPGRGRSGLPVFLDVKFHDIPNTVAGAVRAAASLGVAMLTLHVAGGPAMLRAAVEAAHLEEPCPKLLGVTVLTSLDDADLAALGVPHKVTDQVLRLAELAWSRGPRRRDLLAARGGAAASALRPGVQAGRARHPPRGPRPGRSEADARAGRGDRGRRRLLVIGRPITAAADPRAAAAAIAAEIEARRVPEAPAPRGER